jgi:hypothetical protein
MNELSLFEGGLPSYIKELGLDEETKAIAGKRGNKRISIKGAVFRLIVNGEEIATKEERSMQVVVVRNALKESRTYYEGTYREGEKVAPACWSTDGEKPDAGVEKPKASSCANCPMNIKGSGDNDAKACRYSMRLAVVLADDMAGDVYQLTLPSTSYFGKSDQEKWWPFKQYSQYLAGHNIRLGVVVTEMKFDTKSPVPKLIFRPVKALPQEAYDVIREQGKTPDAANAIRMTVAQNENILPAPKAAKLLTVEDEGIIDDVEPKRVVKKVEPVPEADKKTKLNSVLSKWASDDEEEE